MYVLKTQDPIKVTNTQNSHAFHFLSSTTFRFFFFLLIVIHISHVSRLSFSLNWSHGISLSKLIFLALKNEGCDVSIPTVFSLETPAGSFPYCWCCPITLLRHFFFLFAMNNPQGDNSEAEHPTSNNHLLATSLLSFLSIFWDGVLLFLFRLVSNS